jgi:integrase
VPLVKLEPIALHECRHTYASLLIAAGVNAKAISTYRALVDHGHVRPIWTSDARNADETRGLL